MTWPDDEPRRDGAPDEPVSAGPPEDRPPPAGQPYSGAPPAAGEPPSAGPPPPPESPWARPAPGAEPPPAYEPPPASGPPPAAPPPRTWHAPPPPTLGWPGTTPSVGARYPGTTPEQQYPPVYPGAYPPAVRRTNGLAIAALVCSIGGLVTGIAAPVGAILGHVALRQIGQTGEEGGQLARAAIWIGWIITGLVLLVCCVGLVVGLNAGRTSQ